MPADENDVSSGRFFLTGKLGVILAWNQAEFNSVLKNSCFKSSQAIDEAINV